MAWVNVHVCISVWSGVGLSERQQDRDKLRPSISEFSVHISMVQGREEFEVKMWEKLWLTLCMFVYVKVH